MRPSYIVVLGTKYVTAMTHNSLWDLCCESEQTLELVLEVSRLLSPDLKLEFGISIKPRTTKIVICKGYLKKVEHFMVSN